MSYTYVTVQSIIRCFTVFLFVCKAMHHVGPVINHQKHLPLWEF